MPLLNLLPVNGTESIPFLTGFLYERVNAVDERGSSGGFRFHTGMLHVGCDSLADVTYTTPIWKVECIGKMEADARPATRALPREWPELCRAGKRAGPAR